MTRHVYFEDVEVGQAIPTFSRETGLMEWNRYAAVNDEFVSIHMDDEAGRAAGQDGAFGMGNLRWAYLLNALRDWAGDETEIRELSVQYRSINHKGDVLSTDARVVEKTQDGEANLIKIELDVINQNGEKTTPGFAVVALASRQRSEA